MGKNTSTIMLRDALENQRITVSGVKGASRGTATVVVRDDEKVYVKLENTKDEMGQGSFKIHDNKNLRVEIDMTMDGKSVSSLNLVNVAKLVGGKGDYKCTSWTIAAEDGGDSDHTDVVVNIIATNKW